MKGTILFCILFIASFTSRAQSNSSSPEGIIDNFFSLYQKDGLKPALDSIFAYGDKSVKSALPYIKDTLAGTIKTAGNKYLGYEPIIKRSVSPSYWFYSYLVKYPSNPIRYNFIFYKPQDKWVMMDFSFDSNIGSEAMQLERLEHSK